MTKNLRISVNSSRYSGQSYRDVISDFFDHLRQVFIDFGDNFRRLSTEPITSEMSLFDEIFESQTICRCNYKGTALSGRGSNPRAPAWQPDAQPTESPVGGL